MKAELKSEEACLYLVSGAGLARIGVASDANQRLRELQVGSPVRLELALTHPYADRSDADAVADELCGRFAARRAHGKWYRVTPAEVRRALDDPATREAPVKAAARAAAEAAERERRLARRRGRHARARTEKQLAYQRRRRRQQAGKQKRAAGLLGRGMTQIEAAAAVGVTARTLRNWRAAPAFTRELERERERAQRAHTGDAPTPATARPRPAPTAGRERPDAKRQPREAAAVRESDLERKRPPPPPAPRSRQPSNVRLGFGGVPIFANTRAGRAERLAHYEARKLNRLPDSLLDYHDALHGRETPAERRAREAHAPAAPGKASLPGQPLA